MFYQWYYKSQWWPALCCHSTPFRMIDECRTTALHHSTGFDSGEEKQKVPWGGRSSLETLWHLPWSYLEKQQYIKALYLCSGLHLTYLSWLRLYMNTGVRTPCHFSDYDSSTQPCFIGSLWGWFELYWSFSNVYCAACLCMVNGLLVSTFMFRLGTVPLQFRYNQHVRKLLDCISTNRLWSLTYRLSSIIHSYHHHFPLGKNWLNQCCLDVISDWISKKVMNVRKFCLFFIQL